jgi:CheY-like chemotaxis protein
MNSPTAVTSKSARKSRDALKVLVVDDDPFQLEIISDILRDLGVRNIIAAPGGQQALQEIAKSKRESAFDLMLSDLHMPGMDGFQFLGAVAQGGFKGALIIVSGQSGDVLHSASLVAKLRRFTLLGSLGKPVDKRALAQLIQTLS